MPCRILFVGSVIKKINSVACSWKKLINSVLLARIDLSLSAYLWCGNDGECRKSVWRPKQWKRGIKPVWTYGCDNDVLMGFHKSESPAGAVSARGSFYRSPWVALLESDAGGQDHSSSWKAELPQGFGEIKRDLPERLRRGENPVMVGIREFRWVTKTM